MDRMAKTGTADIDPYARAALRAASYRSDRATASRSLPPPTRTAAHSTALRRHAIGNDPAARFWTVTLYDQEAVSSPMRPIASASVQEIARHADGSFEIVVGPARGGQLDSDRRHRPLRRALRLYDTRLASLPAPQGCADAAVTEGGCP